MNKKIIAIIIASLFIISVASALTWTIISTGKYKVTFNDGSTVNVSNIVYDNKAKEISANVETGNKGLTIQQITEIQSFSQDLKGRNNRYDKTVIVQN